MGAKMATSVGHVSSTRGCQGDALNALCPADLSKLRHVYNMFIRNGLAGRCYNEMQRVISAKGSAALTVLQV